MPDTERHGRFAVAWRPCALGLFVAFGLQLGAGPVNGLDPNKTLSQYSHESWASRQGLPHNHVQAILQSSDGYLWLGTEEGLCRFDGVRFTVFDTITGHLQGPSVSALCQDRQGNLWIGTSGGLTRYREGEFTTLTTADGLPNDVIRALVEGHDGSLWIGTAGGVAHLRDGTITALTVRDGLSNGYVRALCEDDHGVLWIGTSGGGLNRYAAGKFQVFTTDNGLSSNLIKSVHVDRAGNVWVGTRAGLSRLCDNRFTTAALPQETAGSGVWAIHEDRQGILWAGTDSGLHRLKDHRWERFTEPAELCDIVDTLAEDSEGNLWVGTNGHGLSCLKDSKFDILTARDGLASDTVWTVCQDRDGALWFGTEQGVTRLWRGRLNTYSMREGLSSPAVTALAPAADGSLWVGTDAGGLHRLRDGKFNVYTQREGLAANDIRCIHEDRRGNVWIGTLGSGLYRFQNGRFTAFTLRNGLAHDTVHALHEEPDGTLWIGTGGGLSRYQKGAFTTYAAERLPAQLVFCIHEGPPGTLWLATDRGLVHFAAEKGTRCPLEEPSFNGMIWSVMDDRGGNLWLTSNKGIARVRPADLEDFLGGHTPAVPCTVFSTADGLKSNECNGAVQPTVWRTTDGRLWFATYQGAASMDPAGVHRNTKPPSVVIERVVLDRQVVWPGRPVSLPPGRGELECHYTGLSFAAPERIRFRYKLEGFDPDWVEAGTRRDAYYTNLPPGTYTFRVWACNSDGVWNEDSAAMVFELQPHFYQTRWFYLVCITAPILMGLAGHGLRIRRLKVREQELSRRVDERTESLRQEVAERCRTEERLRQAKEAAEAALTRVKQLQGLLPICCYCKRVRDDQNYWQQVEAYISSHSEAQFSHGICPDCYERVFQEVRDLGDALPPSLPSP